MTLGLAGGSGGVVDLSGGLDCSTGAVICPRLSVGAGAACAPCSSGRLYFSNSLARLPRGVEVDTTESIL